VSGEPVVVRGRALQRALFSRESDEWGTPAALLSSLDAEFHFELDVCASPSNAKAQAYYTAEDDGLMQPWAPATCWMNPPYSECATWMGKAAGEASIGATVVALVPARTDTAWFHEQVLARGAEVRFLRGRLRFEGGASTAPFPSMVVVYRPAPWTVEKFPHLYSMVEMIRERP